MDEVAGLISSGNGGSGGGSDRHDKLTLPSRALPDQHPMDAITGLKDALEALEGFLSPSSDLIINGDFDTAVLGEYGRPVGWGGGNVADGVMPLSSTDTGVLLGPVVSILYSVPNWEAHIGKTLKWTVESSGGVVGGGEFGVSFDDHAPGVQHSADGTVFTVPDPVLDSSVTGIYVKFYYIVYHYLTNPVPQSARLDVRRVALETESGETVGVIGPALLATISGIVINEMETHDRDELAHPPIRMLIGGVGGGGGGLVYLAGESMPAGTVVSVYMDGVTPKLCPASAESAFRPAFGFIDASVSAGSEALMQGQGILTGLHGLTPGADVFLSTVPGQVTHQADFPEGNYVQRLGVALDATTVFFDRGVSRMCVGEDP